jgi:NAD dependent epimerase/dehydratase family enzyme
MSKIAIVGATGPTGIHLVAELGKTAAAVRVIARDGDKLAQLFPEAAVEKRSALRRRGRSDRAGYENRYWSNDRKMAFARSRSWLWDRHSAWICHPWHYWV